MGHKVKAKRFAGSPNLILLAIQVTSKGRSLAQYFFDVHDSKLSTHDDDGTECADRDAIVSEALRALCEIAADHSQRYLDQNLRIVVRDSSDQIAFTASLNLTSAWHVEQQQVRAA